MSLPGRHPPSEDIYAHAKSVSITAETARVEVWSRKVRTFQKPLERAFQRGWYDTMLGIVSLVQFNPAEAQQYRKGKIRAQEFRALLRGKPWTRTEIIHAGQARWKWYVYVEGWIIANGVGQSEKIVSVHAESALLDRT